MKRHILSTLLSLFLLVLLFISSNSQLPKVRAECYQLVSGGTDAIVVPCPNNDPGGEDSDGDGVLNRDDNCPSVPNADQLNTWGNGEGNACEQANVGNGSGALAFQQNDGSYDVYGDCYTDDFGEVQCRLLAQLPVCDLTSTVGTSAYAPNPSASSQQVLVTLMQNSGTQRVYQINIQDTNGFNLGSEFNITYNNVDCPQLAPPPIPVTDSDNDHLLYPDDYCPNAAGGIHGCPDLASYYAVLDSMGIDYQKWNTQGNSNTNNSGSDSSTCDEGPENINDTIWVDHNENASCNEGNDLHFESSNTTGTVSHQFLINNAFCNAVYYQHEACQNWAADSDDPYYLNSVDEWCSSDEVRCRIPWSTYCAVMNNPNVCSGYTSFDQYCIAHTNAYECREFSACVQSGQNSAVCPYLTKTCTYVLKGYYYQPSCSYNAALPASSIPADVRPLYCSSFNNQPQGCAITP